VSDNPTTTARRDWNWADDGDLDGHYVETRQATVKKGPSAGKTKLVLDFHVGLDDELVSVWETTVIRSKFKAELKARGAADFEPGERIEIRPLKWREGPNGPYRDFDVWFEYAAPKPTAAELLDVDGIDVGEHPSFESDGGQ
jgi:hypothetical protein